MAQMTKAEVEARCKDYKPEIIEYDPEVDGGEDHLIREELFEKKDELHDDFEHKVEQIRHGRKVRR